MTAVAVVAISIFIEFYFELPKEYFPWVFGFWAAFFLFFVRPLFRILITGTAFTLTDRGLIANIGDIDFVAWSEIENATIGNYGGAKLITLDLRDIDTVVARLPWLRRIYFGWYFKSYGGKPNLYASFGEGGADRLLQLIRQHIDAPKDNQHP